MRVLGNAADAVQQLLQYGDRGPSSCPPSRIPRLLKGLLDTVTFRWLWIWLSLVVSQSHKELSSVTGSTVWEAVERVATDASLVMFC